MKTTTATRDVNTTFASTRAKVRAINLVSTITEALRSRTCPPRFMREVRSVLLALGNAGVTSANAAVLVGHTWQRHKTTNVATFISYFEAALAFHPTEIEDYLDLNATLMPDEDAGNLLWKGLRYADVPTAARLKARFESIVVRNAR